MFVLYEIEGLSLQEIGNCTGAPLQTVYSRLKSARRALEDRFRQAYLGTAALDRESRIWSPGISR